MGYDRNMRKLLVAAVVVALALTGCGTKSQGQPEAQPHLTGSVLVSNVGWDSALGAGVGDTCWGYGGYKDIDEGASVTVTNESGTVIGSATLAGGILVASPVNPVRMACKYTFDTGIVPDAKFYTFGISHRDGPSFSRADLEADGWNVELTLGF